MQTDIFHRRPVVIVFSVLAGLQVLTAGAALADIFGRDVAAFITLCVAALQAAATVYVQGMVTPWNDVVSKVQQDGTLLTGPAAGRSGPADPEEQPGPTLPPLDEG